MKKIKIFILFMTLFLGMFFIMPVKVFAVEALYPSEWYNYISQYDFGCAYGEIEFVRGQYHNSTSVITIVEEPSHEYDGWYIDYYWNHYAVDLHYFEPELRAALQPLLFNDENILWYLEENYEDFDGYFYWNFEEKYWQVEYYGTTELDYYMQRVEDLEDEISLLEGEIQDLEDEISLLEGEIQDLEDEISLLEGEISSLEDEIQQLEEALDLEYDRGYNDGYEIGYSEGLLVENNDIDIIKWFVPLVVIIIVVGIIEPIILCKRRG